jgi:hypothetical protein
VCLELSVAVLPPEAKPETPAALPEQPAPASEEQPLVMARPPAGCPMIARLRFCRSREAACAPVGVDRRGFLEGERGAAILRCSSSWRWLRYEALTTA